MSEIKIVQTSIPMEVLESINRVLNNYIQAEDNNMKRMLEAKEDCSNHIAQDLEIVYRFMHSQDFQADIDLVKT